MITKLSLLVGGFTYIYLFIFCLKDASNAYGNVNGSNGRVHCQREKCTQHCRLSKYINSVGQWNETACRVSGWQRQYLNGSLLLRHFRENSACKRHPGCPLLPWVNGRTLLLWFFKPLRCCFVAKKPCANAIQHIISRNPTTAAKSGLEKIGGKRNEENTLNYFRNAQEQTSTQTHTESTQQSYLLYLRIVRYWFHSNATNCVYKIASNCEGSCMLINYYFYYYLYVPFILVSFLFFKNKWTRSLYSFGHYRTTF